MKINIILNEPCFENISLALAYRFVDDPKWFESEHCFYIEKYIENLEEDNLPFENFEVIDSKFIDGYILVQFKDRYNQLWWTTHFVIVDYRSPGSKHRWD